MHDYLVPWKEEQNILCKTINLKFTNSKRYRIQKQTEADFLYGRAYEKEISERFIT